MAQHPDPRHQEKEVNRQATPIMKKTGRLQVVSKP
jgi:hypothetical protein